MPQELLVGGTNRQLSKGPQRTFIHRGSTVMRPADVQQSIKVAEARWRPSKSDAASDSRTDTRKISEESALISCTSQAVTMIMSDKFKRSTRILRQNGPEGLPSVYSRLCREANGLSQLSHAKGRRGRGKDTATEGLQGLREKHNSLFRLMDKAKAFATHTSPSLKDTIQSLKTLGPVCTCQANKSDAKGRKWQQVYNSENDAGTFGDNPECLRARYEAYIAGQRYAPPESRSEPLPNSSNPDPPLGKEPGQSMIDPPDSWDEEREQLMEADADGTQDTASNRNGKSDRRGLNETTTMVNDYRDPAGDVRSSLNTSDPKEDEPEGGKDMASEEGWQLVTRRGGRRQGGG